MNLKINYNKYSYLLIIIISTLMGCQPDDFNNGNGLSDQNIDASFTITPVEGAINRYILKAQTTNVIASKWDVGDGPYMGKMTEEIFFPDAGNYTITHTAIGKGGLTAATSQELIVEQSDPVAGNLVQGGKFADANDHEKWTILPISASGATWIFNQGSATIKTTEQWAQQGIYQAIDVVKDKEYSIDMLVSGGSFTDTWFEVYAGTTPPVEGQDYSDNKVMGLSTWDGCATSPFSGRLSIVGCVKNSQTNTISNKVTFDTTGTIYLVIRSGGGGFDPDGITITNVEMRGSN